ncbi:hypothetical protein RFI_05348 [Reticulomyxa filosa]|uniref:Uncharacterized protein n=1 Tax=Reticulomyxa filosa TaxID=46433 RepID=X6P2I5_RETFI|nr:hypothetical protein RFI_05348 [Reticulomyxa filosa]|eukprot:ETO31772.1 hypothetical protein RFI_05348 [Reticulomyxa filosa]
MQINTIHLCPGPKPEHNGFINEESTDSNEGIVSNKDSAIIHISQKAAKRAFSKISKVQNDCDVLMPPQKKQKITRKRQRQRLKTLTPAEVLLFNQSRSKKIEHTNIQCDNEKNSNGEIPLQKLNFVEQEVNSGDRKQYVKQKKKKLWGNYMVDFPFMIKLDKNHLSQQTTRSPFKQNSTEKSDGYVSHSGKFHQWDFLKDFSALTFSAPYTTSQDF